MLKINTSLVLILFILGLPMISTAQEVEDKPTRPFMGSLESIRMNAETAKEKFKAKREENQENRRIEKSELFEKKEEWRENMSSIRSERIEAYIDRVEKRFSAAIERIENLIDRVEDRMDNLATKNKNFDPTPASAIIVEAKSAIAEAKVALADFKSKASLMVVNDKPEDSLAEIRLTASTVIEKIKTAHQKVVEVVILIKSFNSEDGSTEN